MTATTINSFPSLHSWSSPRSWALAIIVLLHAGFFWALTNGLSVPIPDVLKPKAPELIPVVERLPTPPEPIKPIDVQLPINQHVTVVKPVIDVPVFEQEEAGPYVPEPTPPGSFDDGGSVSPPLPVIVEPHIDTRRALSEPYYPPQEIRMGHEGTVVLSLHILADGRVGDVKVERSSGFAKLDESAKREAKKWRFVPGTRDGAPMAMWKQMPVTFRLNQ